MLAPCRGAVSATCVTDATCRSALMSNHDPERDPTTPLDRPLNAAPHVGRDLSHLPTTASIVEATARGGLTPGSLPQRRPPGCDWTCRRLCW
ncbi:hypothetical protein VFPFJ_09353 [Purpureocillium lilacinum]|uniref:Uncharacterized protein n=1 Tax=Purpureocillium lilacinum TaxID=33203 RepID=A0A179GU94_PURLI|nr:hypothetical protein VFPFJ_09353 [Purpureocillium lilacinum]OAQ80900.1 hypothetical protein VFPFJ_09353 [Purpureocillium lilacinum]